MASHKKGASEEVPCKKVNSGLKRFYRSQKAGNHEVTAGAPSKKQDTLLAAQYITDHVDVACNRSSHSTREPNNVLAPIPDCRDAVQRSLDACAIVASKIAHRFLGGNQVRAGYLKDGVREMG